MTQREFLDENIPFVQMEKNVRYKICDGVIITFQKCENKDCYNLLLNGHEIERNQNYSKHAVKNSFLSITKIYNLHSYQWYPISDGTTYMIPRDVTLPKKVNWDEIKREEEILKEKYKDAVPDVINMEDKKMNVTTKFGEFKDIKIEPYLNNETYTLSKIEEINENEYMLLGFDAPTTNDNVWRFWVECGEADGGAETYVVDLSQEEMTSIKEMWGKYKVNLLEERAVFLANLHLPDGFKVEQFEIYRKGDLKGYGNGYLLDSKKDTGYEFLFRFDDPANGEPNTLVSIDYGWEIENSEKVFNTLENSIRTVAQENAELLEIIGVISEKNVSLNDRVKKACEKLQPHIDKGKPRDEMAK